jgi:hypothetical protein
MFEFHKEYCNESSKSDDYPISRCFFRKQINREKKSLNIEESRKMK